MQLFAFIMACIILTAPLHTNLSAYLSMTYGILPKKGNLLRKLAMVEKRLVFKAKLGVKRSSAWS